MTSQAPGEGEKPSSSGETTEVDQGEEESQVGGVTRSVVGEEMIPVPDIYRQGEDSLIVLVFFGRFEVG